MTTKRDPADIKKIAQLTVRLNRLKQEVAVQRGRADALDRINDSLLEQRNELFMQMSTIRDGGTEEDRRALFEGTFAGVWCACGNCPQCDAQEGKAGLTAVRRPLTFSELLDAVEDVVGVMGGRPSEHGMASLVKPIEMAGQPSDVQVSVQRAWVSNSQGKRMEMMVLVAGAQIGTSFIHDATLEANVREQLTALFGKLDDISGKE